MTASLTESTPAGRLATLTALRDRLAGDIDGCRAARDVASLSQRLMDVLAQIDELEPLTASPKETGLSDFEKRLRERQQSTKTVRRAKNG